MSRNARIILSSIVVLLGGVGLCCGVYSGVLFPLLFQSDIARVERLSTTSYVAIEDGAPGREVLVEGTLSARNRASAEGFIVYTRYTQATEPGGDRVWREVERVQPPLLIEVPGGLVQTGDGYTLSGPTVRAEGAGVRVEGLRAGASVVVVGTLAAGPEGMEVDATLLGAGTREEFLEYNRGTVLFLRILGRALLGCGGLIAGAGLVLLFLAVRRSHP